MGRPLSPEHRRRISESLKRRNGHINPRGKTFDELMKKAGDLSYLSNRGNSAKALKERCEKLERVILERDVKIEELTDYADQMKRHCARLSRQIEDLVARRTSSLLDVSRPVEREDSVHVDWGKSGSPISRGNAS